MILGGVDDNYGPALFTIDMDNLPNRVSFAALGSGSTEALSVLEIARRNWRMKLYSNRSSSSNSSNDNNDVVNSRLNETFINSNNSNENNNQVNDNRLNNNFNQARSPSFGNQHNNNNHNVYKEQINVIDAIPIIRRAVQAGILNDLGSGSHVDFCVVTYNYTKQWREYLLSTWDDNRLNKSTIIMNYNDDKENLRNGMGGYERVSSNDGSSNSSDSSDDDGGNNNSDGNNRSVYDVICSDNNNIYNSTATTVSDTTSSNTANTTTTISASNDNSSTETLLGRRIFSKQKLIKRLVKGKMIEEMTDNNTYFLDQDLSLNIQLVTYN